MMDKCDFELADSRTKGINIRQDMSCVGADRLTKSPRKVETQEKEGKPSKLVGKLERGVRKMPNPSNFIQINSDRIDRAVRSGKR